MRRRAELVGIGDYLRRRIIPEEMSVTEAARKLGVSRVALSNLLNGRASLSQQMALRLKAVFGADPEELFGVQTTADRELRRDEERTIALGRYVPCVSLIKAHQIHGWADQGDEVRSRLPVLMRKLIRSTGRDLSVVDFPGYGDGQRSGWDGRVEAAAATPWIPEGTSGWELSTTKDPLRKANADFRNRLALPVEERTQITFVFVCSRKWPGKDKWAAQRKAEGHWKDVRALDASDLEQWVEESVEGQVWLAEQLDLPSLEECMTLERAWNRWAEASEPPMSDAIFEPAVAAHGSSLADWLKRPSDRPFVVAADSKEEALAFLACLFRDERFSDEFSDRAVVIKSAQTLATLAASTSRFIPVVSGKEAERELPPVYRKRHSIVVRPRNAVDRQPDIVLGLLGYESFRRSLEAMGFRHTQVERLARESGRSPTILRRRLSKIDAIRKPPWAEDAKVARTLVPLMLIGAWHAESEADREVLRTLANLPFRRIEEDLAVLSGFDDTPVWSVGEHRGVASKIDALFAVGRYMTANDIEDFLCLAEYVLSESDPALELPEDQRWAAGVYGKVRDHSDALRSGVSETLVLLAVHGNDLFQRRLGIDAEGLVAGLVGRLISPQGRETPLALETLLSYDRDLPTLAEAAPNEFLRLLESDLGRGGSALFELLKPVEPSIFADCPRTGLLWALECLAWNPSHLPRVALILGQLSKTPIEDNWANRPINSLEAIFRSWMPQTAAPLDARFQTLELLCRRIPKVGWQICMTQFQRGPRTGMYSHRPRWRADASGAGEPVPFADRQEFNRRTCELALEWPQPRGAEKLGDLVEILGDMSDEQQSRVWALIDEWLEGGPNEAQTENLRERLRHFGRATARPAFAVEPALRKRARALYDRLAPEAPEIRHAWLFAEHWIHDWPEGLGDAVDFSEREECIKKRRTEVMTEIWCSGGLAGALSLLPSSNAAGTVGIFASWCVSGQSGRAEVLRTCLSGDLPAELGVDEAKLDGFVGGFIWALNEDSRGEVLRDLVLDLHRDQMVRLLLCAPFGEQTWRIVEGQEGEVGKEYWRKVSASTSGVFSQAECTELTDRLLEAGRPRAAFGILSLDWDRVETSRLRRLLRALLVGGEQDDANLPIQAYDISRALDSLGGRTGVPWGEMADLEFATFEALQWSQRKFPNLERRIAEDPSYFVWLVALIYKRNDGREDPEGWPVSAAGRNSALTQTAYSVLEGVSGIPGTDQEGSIDARELHAWTADVRRLSAECGRLTAADTCIGQLFARKPPEEGGPWPCRSICEALETVATEQIENGFFVGLVNARGVTHGEDGREERELADKYRAWAAPLSFKFPFVSQVLKGIAASYSQTAAYRDSDAQRRERLEV